MKRQGVDWVVTTVAGAGPSVSGSADGTNTEAQFSMPQGVAVDIGGNLYVADTFNYVIRKITPVDALNTVCCSLRHSRPATTCEAHRSRQ